MSAEIHLQRATREQGLPSEAEFRQWAELALGDRAGRSELTIRLVDEAESQALNLAYRSQDKPTNVLSFPLEAPPVVETDLLGDLVICASVVAREAVRQGKPVAAHWAHMVIHGVLHLLGFDHQNERQASEMECIEVELLGQLGFADPYRSDETHEQ